MANHKMEETIASKTLVEERYADIRAKETELLERQHHCSSLISKRWIVAYMGLFFGLISFVYTVNISIVLPFMVKTHIPAPPSSVSINVTNHNNNVSFLSNRSLDRSQMAYDDCPEIARSISESTSAEFAWSKQEQSFILSGFYYGYLFQTPFGWIAGKYSGSHIISISMAISSAVMLLFPVLARSSVYAVIVARVLLGLCSSASWPAWYKLISQWALPHERSRFNALCLIGKYTGTIIVFFSSGFLCVNGFDNGWGSVFYIHGIVGVTFVVIWACLIHDAPADHPRISRAELMLLMSQANGINTTRKIKPLSVPWRRILTYRPVLVVFVCHFLESYLFYMILSCLPLYMKAVLRFDIQSNGIFSSLPFICSVVCIAISSIMADALISRRCLSTTTTRKLLQNIGKLTTMLPLTMGFIGSSVFIFVTGFLSCGQRMWVIVLLCVCMCFDGLGFGAGVSCTAVDISPRYAPLVCGISSTFSTIAGIIAPLIVAELTSNDTAEEWSMVFCIAAGCGVVAAIIYGLFSSSELAPWDKDRAIELNVYIETIDHVFDKNGHISEDLINKQTESIS